jgi:hypothetical protein
MASRVRLDERGARLRFGLAIKPSLMVIIEARRRLHRPSMLKFAAGIDRECVMAAPVDNEMPPARQDATPKPAGRRGSSTGPIIRAALASGQCSRV